MLETARLLSHRKVTATIIGAAPSGDENGLFGAAAPGATGYRLHRRRIDKQGWTGRRDIAAPALDAAER